MDRKPKPAHLGVKYAEQFHDTSVVDAYQYRASFPAEVFTKLLELMDQSSSHAILDIGCGRGEIARQLVEKVERVDAVDISPTMIEVGKRLQNGDHPNLRWICAKAEEAPLNPPYNLITAGNSLHWMDWDKLMPVMSSALAPKGTLAIVSTGNGTTPWDDDLLSLIREFSTNREFKPYNLMDELQTRGLFEVDGSCETAPVPFTQPVEEYIEAIHSQNGFSRERMTKDAALEFDNRVRNLVSRYTQHGALNLDAIASVTWGCPCFPFN
ncbi:methyltransferase domain-containing protein [Alicyclobacillus curvatus]|nr:methyltransferase domain-containing protein [Alicyclobacillus curvatus]